MTAEQEKIETTEGPTPEASAPQGPAVALPPTEAPELIDIEHFMKVKLRVGRIESVELIPKSKKLYKLQVYLGEELGRRQILSGIAQHYTPEALTNRKIIVVTNLKPATLMGHESQGMLLASSPADNSRVILADPGDAEVGDTVR